jgi:monoamine oxidase
VIEARDRVGGRVWNHELGGGIVSERGGTYVGPTQNRILNLMKEMSIDKFDAYNVGNNVYIAPDGSRSTWSDTGPTGTAPLDPLILPELAETVMQLDQMSTEVPVDAPWQAAKAREWDAQTLETWINANTVTDRFRKLIPVATRPIFGTEPRDLSLLFVLFYIAASGDEQNPGTFERNFDTRDGGQMWRVVGGSQILPVTMAKQLGRRVVLRSPVRRMVQDKSGVRLESDRVTVRAKRAIVAVPPALAARIDYSPVLPPERDQLTQRVGQGYLTKVAAVYETPFWRDQGLTGTIVNAAGGPVTVAFDDSPPGGKPGVVFGFVGGDDARRYRRLSASERRTAVINQFVTAFGPQAAKPTDFFDTEWATEPWSRGGPVGCHAPGTLVAFGPSLRTPVGLIHWAGTETSTYWNGYMDGAVRSGERAAREVLAAL